MNATYYPLPTYPVILPDADPTAIGRACFLYVIAEDATASLSTRELELADLAGKQAVVGHGKEPGKELATIQRARDLVARTLLRRHAEERAAAAAAAVAPQPEPVWAVSQAEQALDEARELTREEKITALLEELLHEVRPTRTGPPEVDGGLGVRLLPVVPQLPPGAVGLRPRQVA